MSDAGLKDNVRADALSVEFKRLTADCSRAAFSCGDSDIDRWFRKKAQTHHNGLRCRVVTAHLTGNPAPVGFYAATMRLEPIADLPREFRPTLAWWSAGHYPAFHLQYVAVQKAMQRKEFGTLLMGALINDFYEVATRTGIVALTLVAIDQETAKFYDKLGFVRFGDQEAKQPSMFLPAMSVITVRESLDAGN